MMMFWGTLGSVRPSQAFRPERDVAEVKAALEKKDVSRLVRVLTTRSNEQRQILAQTYQSLTKQDLRAGLKKVLSGDLKALIIALMMTPDQFEAHRLKLAMEGLGTDEETLLEILCTRTPARLSNIRSAYTKECQQDLEKGLVSESSGDFSKLLVALLKKEYLAGVLDLDVAVLCEELRNKKPSADPWIQILTKRDPSHLRNVLIHVEAERGQTVTTEIEKRFGGLLSGDLKLGLQTLVRCIENPNLYLARRMQCGKSSVLQGVMVAHSEEDLLLIRVAFRKDKGRSLYTTLQEQFKGDLLQAVLAVCRSED